jgi:hypothetical protein
VGYLGGVGRRFAHSGYMYLLFLVTGGGDMVYHSVPNGVNTRTGPGDAFHSWKSGLEDKSDGVRY